MVGSYQMIDTDGRAVSQIDDAGWRAVDGAAAFLSWALSDVNIIRAQLA